MRTISKIAMIGALACVCAAGGAAFLALEGGATDLSSKSECFAGAVNYCIVEQKRSGRVDLPAPTAYWQSSREQDEHGLPVSVAPDGQRFRNPSSVAFAWFSRSNISFEEACRIYTPGKISDEARAYLEKTAVPIAGGKAITWQYDYETQVNDVLLKPPFTSAFSQAAIIERLLLHHCRTGEERYAELARRAGRALAVPVTAGGLRSEADDFVWFQEVPLPDRHNPFILNAHLYAVQNLLRLDRLFPEEGFRALAEKGVRSVRRALHVVDTGYWNRYDLRPRYNSVSFWIEGSGVLREAVFESGREGRIQFRKAEQEPAGNGFAQVTKEQMAEHGVQLPKKPLGIWFATNHGREFSPALLEVPLQLRVSFDGVPQDVRVAALSARPGDVEIAGMPNAAWSERLSDRSTIIVPVSLADMGWGQVGSEYVAFHAFLLSSIARSIGDQQLFLRGVRWALFARRYAEKKPAPVVRSRWPWTDDSLVADAVWERFGEMAPAGIADAEIEKLLLALPIDNVRRAAAFNTLPVSRSEQ